MVRYRAAARVRLGTHKSKPGENQVEELIQHFHVNDELPEQAVRRPVDVVEVDGTMNCGEKRTVQPPTTL